MPVGGPSVTWSHHGRTSERGQLLRWRLPAVLRRSPSLAVALQAGVRLLALEPRRRSTASRRSRATREPERARERGDMKALISALNRLFHRGLDLLLRVDGSAALNTGRTAARGGPGVAAELLAALQMMQAEAFDPVAGTIDYRRLADSQSYAHYRDCTAGLIGFDPASLGSREESVAFWINLYNALIIDAVIAFGLQRAVREDLGFFRRAAYIIGDRRYSADDIEHGTLRGNRRHFYPVVVFPQFAPDDARLQYTIGALDPRIHCALVCASRSCPPIAAYEPSKLDAQLDIAARSFVNGGGVTLGTGYAELRLSPIFGWYRRDFGGKAGIREFVLRFLDEGEARQALREERCRIRYQEYDWSLNAA